MDGDVDEVGRDAQSSANSGKLFETFGTIGVGCATVGTHCVDELETVLAGMGFPSSNRTSGLPLRLRGATGELRAWKRDNLFLFRLFTGRTFQSFISFLIFSDLDQNQTKLSEAVRPDALDIRGEPVARSLASNLC